MTDRELLELAAKAARYSTSHYWHEKDRYEFTDGPHGWNPHSDSGEALLLAVKLKMKITIGNAIVMVEAIGIPDVGVQFTDDPAAATRRAIVRAAAAIGEQMP